MVDGVERLTRCDCWRSVVIQKNLADARIPPKFARAELTTYKPDTDSQRDALRLAKKFVESFPVEQKGLVFHGPTGVGKTHLAIGLLKAVIRDKGARNFQTTELLRCARPTTLVDERDGVLQHARADVLVLDDLGVERHRVGRGDARSCHQYPLQRPARRSSPATFAAARQHRHELVHGPARRRSRSPARNVRVGRVQGADIRGVDRITAPPRPARCPTPERLERTCRASRWHGPRSIEGCGRSIRANWSGGKPAAVKPGSTFISRFARRSATCDFNRGLHDPGCGATACAVTDIRGRRPVDRSRHDLLRQRHAAAGTPELGLIVQACRGFRPRPMRK